MNTATAPLSVKVDIELKDRMKTLAKVQHRSTHWIMREAIRQYVDREEKRETFRQDGMKAWNEYQTTGLHVTSEEADSWLAKLEDGQDVELPECHA